MFAIIKFLLAFRSYQITSFLMNLKIPEYTEYSWYHRRFFLSHTFWHNGNLNFSKQITLAPLGPNCTTNFTKSIPGQPKTFFYISSSFAKKLQHSSTNHTILMKLVNFEKKHIYTYFRQKMTKRLEKTMKFKLLNVLFRKIFHSLFVRALRRLYS